MALEAYQQTLTMGRLYAIKVSSPLSGSERIGKFIWVNSGTVDIKASASATQPAVSTDMTLNTEDAGVAGTHVFQTLTNYIWIAQNTGTTTEIVISGVEAEDLGVIA